jgi:hypothetical protein
VQGLFDPSTSFAGSTFRVAGVAEDTIRADNSFRVEPIEPGEYVIAVIGPNHLNRQVKVEMKAGGPNEIRALTLAEDADFNLPAFNEIYRDDGERGTARMLRQPHFKIKREDFQALSGDGGSRLMGDIEEFITGDMARAIAPFLRGVQVTRAANLPRYSTPCDVPAFEVHIYAESDLRNDDNERLLGWAWWCWWPERSEVRGGLMSFDDSALGDTVLHELVHLLGGADHLESEPWRSIIGAPNNSPGFTRMDELQLRYLYQRPPGIRTPDDGRQAATNDLTRVSSSGAMEMRCLLFADGTARIERGYPGQLSWSR